MSEFVQQGAWFRLAEPVVVTTYKDRPTDPKDLTVDLCVDCAVNYRRGSPRLSVVRRAAPSAHCAGCGAGQGHLVAFGEFYDLDGLRRLGYNPQEGKNG